MQWEAMAREGYARGDARTWPDRGADAFYSKITDNPNVTSLFTASYLAMAEALYSSAEGTRTGSCIPLEWYRHRDRPENASLPLPGGALAVHAFPRTPAADGAQPAQPSLHPHIDHAGPRMSPRWALDCLRERGWDSCCLPMRMSTMHYLSSVDETGHGGTYVWPRSHTLLKALAASDPVGYAQADVHHRSIYKSVGAQLGKARVLDLSPVELLVRRGDVMFADMFLVHSGSDNHGTQPRLAFNMKFGPLGRQCG